MDIRDWGRIFQCFSLPTPTALDRIEAKVYIRGRGNETKSWIGKSQAIDRTLFLPLCGTKKRDCAPGRTGGADFSRAWSHRRSELNSTRLVAPAERNKHTTARLGEPAEQRITSNKHTTARLGEPAEQRITSGIIASNYCKDIISLSGADLGLRISYYQNYSFLSTRNKRLLRIS